MGGASAPWALPGPKSGFCVVSVSLLMETHGQMALCMLKVRLLHDLLLSFCPRERHAHVHMHTHWDKCTGCVCVWCVCVCVCFPCGSAGKESACHAGDLGLIPGLGRSPGEGKGYPLQYSGLENSMDCKVHGVAKSRTWLSDFHFIYIHMCLYVWLAKSSLDIFHNILHKSASEIFAQPNTYIYTFTHIYRYIHRYIYIYIHTYWHIHIHTYAQ